jgi:hypothetical protein
LFDSGEEAVCIRIPRAFNVIADFVTGFLAVLGVAC